MLIILPSKHTLTSFLMRFLLEFQYSSKTTCDVGMTRMFHHIWLFQDHLLGNLDMKNHSQNQCRVILKKTAKHSAVCGMKSIPESFYYHSHSGPPQIQSKRYTEGVYKIKKKLICCSKHFLCIEVILAFECFMSCCPFSPSNLFLWSCPSMPQKQLGLHEKVLKQTCP